MLIFIFQQNEDGKKNTENMKKVIEEVQEAGPQLAEKIQIITDRCWPERKTIFNDKIMIPTNLLFFLVDDNAEPCEGAHKVFECYLKVAKEVIGEEIE